MSYNILSIRSVDDEHDSLYPDVLNGGKAVLTKGPDGDGHYKFAALNLSVWEVEGDNYTRLVRFSGDNGVRYGIILTRNRLIALCSRFKKGNVSDLVFDLPGFYLAGSLISAFQSRNRAITGHVLYFTVSRISALGTGSLKEANKLRIFLREGTEGTQRTIFLEIGLPMRIDPRPIAQILVQRIANQWIKSNQVKDKNRAAVEALQEAPLLQTSSEKWVVGYTIPGSLVMERF